MTPETALVAGNAASVAALDMTRICADDYIVRINNFFFEPKFYLGQRVDCAFLAGDPRVAPFMLETLYQCLNHYDLRRWSSHNPQIIKVGQRRFGDLYQPMKFRDQHIEREVADLIASHQRHPTTGVYATLMVHGMGIPHIILAGINFHTAPLRYPFEPGPHYRALMGQDINQRGNDAHLHSSELDLRILACLQARDDVHLSRLTDHTPLNTVMDVAPVRDGPRIAVTSHIDAPTDWAAMAGLYPIHLLRIMRWVRSKVRAANP